MVQIYFDGVLKGWEKGMLAPGEGKRMDVALDKYAFSEWNSAKRSWVVASREIQMELRQDANTLISSVVYEVKSSIH